MIKFFTILILFSISFYCFDIEPKIHEKNLLKQSFKKLEQIRNIKKNLIIEKLKSVRQEAMKVQGDKILANFLISTIQMIKYTKTITSKSSLDTAYKSINKFKYIINKKCILSYGQFYNVLFLNKQGDIIHRRRPDNYKGENLFKGPLLNSKLSQYLQHRSQGNFVDFEFFPPSNRLAAFFPFPIYDTKDSSKHVGWIILQYSINHLNNIILEKREVGKTGEILIVNKHYNMLTKSKFQKSQEQLPRINPKIIQNALKQGKGEKIFKGYLGHAILSSFEPFSLWNQQWVILSEIELDEIITQNYLENQKYYLSKLPQKLKQISTQFISKKIKQTSKLTKMNVDMDEYKSTAGKEALATTGIASCTGFIAYLPGKIGYLAHISPYDKIYNTQNITNFVRHIIENSLYYDLKQSELRNIKIVIIANHMNSIQRTLLKLSSYGIFLSQVKFVYNPNFDYATTTYNPQSDSVQVIWHKEDTQQDYVQDVSRIPTLDKIIKELGHYNPTGYLL